MRLPPIRFTSRGMMLLVLVVALVTTVVVQQIQLRQAAFREEQLRSALDGGDGPGQWARLNWIKAADDWKVAGESPALKDQWARGIRRVTPPPADR